MRYEVAEPPVSASYCHCTRCQRRTGTAASAQARVAPGSFQVTQGAELVREFAPADGWPKCFCSVCGSALWSRHPTDADSSASGSARSTPGTASGRSTGSSWPTRPPGSRCPTTACPTTRSVRPADAASTPDSAPSPKTTAASGQRVSELERERELLNAIANYAPSLICLVDDDGRVRPYASNRAFERTLGYEPHETGGTLFWEKYVADGERAAARDCIVGAIRNHALSRARGPLAPA